MALTFIDIHSCSRAKDEPHTSNLHYSSRAPERLTVSGILPHGTELEPASVADAMKLREWLADWIQRRQFRDSYAATLRYHRKEA